MAKQTEEFNLVLFGAPGSGKGTQSKLIARHYDLTHISTGDLLRSEMERDTPLGKEIRELMNSGQLIDDETVLSLVGSFIKNHLGAKGFIFDGFPRTAIQANALDQMLNLANRPIPKVIHLLVPNSVLQVRLSSRAFEQGRPEDSDPEAINTRFNQHLNSLSQIVGYYGFLNANGRMCNVSGNHSIDDVYNEICHAIDYKF